MFLVALDLRGSGKIFWKKAKGDNAKDTKTQRRKEVKREGLVFSLFYLPLVLSVFICVYLWLNLLAFSASLHLCVFALLFSAFVLFLRNEPYARKICHTRFAPLVRYGVAYQKKSEDDFAEQHRQRMEKNLERRAKEMGYELKKIEDSPSEIPDQLPA